MKGQDTVALPLLSLGDQNEDVLLENLKNMSTNGLRTLVCGYAELEPSWWGKRSLEYQTIIQRDASQYSEGHPEKCKQQLCEKCGQHTSASALATPPCFVCRCDHVCLSSHVRLPHEFSSTLLPSVSLSLSLSLSLQKSLKTFLNK